MGFVTQPSIAKRPKSGAPSIRELHSKGSRPALGLCVIGLTLDAVSVCAEDNRGALEEIHPTVTLPTITVEARSPAFDPAFEINSVTVLDRDTLARSEERDLRGAKARTTVTASRDDVFEDISQADARNGNPERDGFRSTQAVVRLTLAPTARLTLESSALYQQYRAEMDLPGLLPTGQTGFPYFYNSFY
jgi:hypothetical protein